MKRNTKITRRVMTATEIAKEENEQISNTQSHTCGWQQQHRYHHHQPTKPVHSLIFSACVLYFSLPLHSK